MFHYILERTGKSHERRGEPCQDSNATVDLPGGEKLIVVADGVGSCRFSHESARFLTQFMTAYALDNYPVLRGIGPLTSLMITGMNAAYKGLLGHLGAKGIDIDEAHSTLHIAIYDGHEVIFAGAGDGSILGLKDDGCYDVIFSPQKGEFDNATTPFTIPGSHWTADVCAGPYSAVIVSTDGISDLILPDFLRSSGEVIEYRANYLGNRNLLNPEGKEEWNDKFRSYLESATLAGIDASKEWYTSDDLTCVVAINEKKNPPLVEAQSPEYLEGRLKSFLNGETEPKNDAGMDGTPQRDVSATKPKPAARPADRQPSPPKTVPADEEDDAPSKTERSDDKQGSDEEQVGSDASEDRDEKQTDTANGPEQECHEDDGVDPEDEDVDTHEPTEEELPDEGVRKGLLTRLFDKIRGRDDLDDYIDDEPEEKPEGSDRMGKDSKKASDEGYGGSKPSKSGKGGDDKSKHEPSKRTGPNNGRPKSVRRKVDECEGVVGRRRTSSDTKGGSTPKRSKNDTRRSSTKRRR